VIVAPVERHRSATLVLLALIAGVVGLRAQPPPASAETPVYRLEVLPRSDEELLQRFSEAQVAILEKLNRRDREHLVRVEPPVPGLVVPDRWEEDDLRYSPLPAAYGGADEYPKLIVVHQPWQVFGAYEYGRLVRWGPVSTGRRQSPTPSGLFHLTWKAKSRRSTDNQAWLLPWYFNFVNARGVSFHQFDLPGSAASHACVRLLERDARWLYDWGDQWILDANGQTAFPGTPVHVLGEAQHGAMPIWTDVERLDEPIELAPIPERDRSLFQAAIERLSPRVDRIAGCATQRIEGEVADGDAFEAPIGRGLWLVLMSERDPQVSGWRLEIRGAPDRLDDDHVYPVSPPYRSVTPRDIGTMFGRSADEILEFRERPFNFVTTRADQHVAQREVRMYLWPSGLPPGADERAIVRLSLLKLGRGVLTILDGRKGTRLVNEPHEIVEWFRFRVDLCWP
jgi:hypothetical protein